MTAPTPPVPFATGIWIVRTVNGEACYTPATFRYARQCEEAYQERLRVTYEGIWGVLGKGMATKAESEGGDGAE